MSMNACDAHLAELASLVSAPPSADGGPPTIFIPAKDSVLSIENMWKNALDDEVAGLASRLFDRGSGLQVLLTGSLEGLRANEVPLKELRREVLKLIDFLILDARARERLAILSEYVCIIVTACIRVFRVDNDTTTRVDTITTLIAAIELQDIVPDIAALRAILFPPRDMCVAVLALGRSPHPSRPLHPAARPPHASNRAQSQSLCLQRASSLPSSPSPA